MSDELSERCRAAYGGKVIEKSRFLTYAAHTAGEEEARAFLSAVRAQHPLATHVCHAFVADRVGNLMRFSDDGEPQGTAGMPILGVLRARRLFECAVAVVRYFGGIKLGAGGLTRAYSSCAAECLDGAELALWDECTELRVTADYSEVNALTAFSRRKVHGSFPGVCRRRPALSWPSARRRVRRSAPRWPIICAAGRKSAETGKYFAPFPLAH